MGLGLLFCCGINYTSYTRQKSQVTFKGLCFNYNKDTDESNHLHLFTEPSQTGCLLKIKIYTNIQELGLQLMIVFIVD